MKREAQRYLELLERRLVTLRLLATDLDESRSAYVELNLQAMHQHITHQETLCTEIRLLDAELKNVTDTFRPPDPSGERASSLNELEAQMDPASVRQLHLLLIGLSAIQADVRRLSRVHSELLRRSRRSVNVLLNFLAHYSGNYPAAIARPKRMPLAAVGK
jgi:hypothetical protein